jgi:hypothetical protein
MAKDNTFYFSHDYSARSDEKIKELIYTHGCLGYGVYWFLIEDLYNNTNVLRTDYKRISHELRVEEKIVKSIINDFDLFVIKDDNFSSLSVGKRLLAREQKSAKAKESISNRWNKSKPDTNVIRTGYERNTIKESKVKESKENNIEERKLKFASTLEIYKDKYPRSLLSLFFKYWTEPNKSNTKFKQELEKTWSLERRLETWATNDSNFNKKQDNTPEKKYKEFK